MSYFPALNSIGSLVEAAPIEPTPISFAPPIQQEAPPVKHSIRHLTPEMCEIYNMHDATAATLATAEAKVRTPLAVIYVIAQQRTVIPVLEAAGWRKVGEKRNPNTGNVVLLWTKAFEERMPVAGTVYTLRSDTLRDQYSSCCGVRYFFRKFTYTRYLAVRHFNSARGPRINLKKRWKLVGRGENFSWWARF